jgi:putative membrane protein
LPPCRSAGRSKTYAAAASGSYEAARVEHIRTEHYPMAALFAFLHHVSAFTLFAALVVEFVLIRSVLTVESARKIQVADMIFGISAGILLVVGLLRVFYFEKGATYYFHTWTFHAKLSLFVIVGLISIIPTMEFLRWRPAVKAGQVPVVTAAKIKSIRSIIHYEMMGVVLIILCAALMAKGIGLKP